MASVIAYSMSVSHIYIRSSKVSVNLWGFCISIRVEITGFLLVALFGPMLFGVFSRLTLIIMQNCSVIENVFSTYLCDIHVPTNYLD